MTRSLGASVPTVWECWSEYPGIDKVEFPASRDQGVLVLDLRQAITAVVFAIIIVGQM